MEKGKPHVWKWPRAREVRRREAPDERDKSSTLQLVSQASKQLQGSGQEGFAKSSELWRRPGATAASRESAVTASSVCPRASNH